MAFSDISSTFYPCIRCGVERNLPYWVRASGLGCPDMTCISCDQKEQDEYHIEPTGEN